MSDETDKGNALEEVANRVQMDVVPVISFPELETEVDRARIARTWAASTSYSIGDRVVPVVRNGHFYEAVQPGTSQSGAKAYTDWPPVSGLQFIDGSSDPVLTWAEGGDDLFNPTIFGLERNIYDVSRAARNLWLMKARKATQFIQAGDLSFQQVYDHCVEQAEKFYPWHRTVRIVRG